MAWNLSLYLKHHEVKPAHEMGWAALKNGRLLQASEDAGFDVLVTADQSIRYQQNLSNRKIALVVLTLTNWPQVLPHVRAIVDAIDAATPGSYQTVRCGPDTHPASPPGS